MSTATTVKIVRGAHPQTPMPDFARNQKWAHRSAIVLDSFAPARGEMYFDTALFLEFLNMLNAVIGANSVRITIERYKGKSLVLHSCRELAAFYENVPEEDRDLPEEIIWFKNENPVGAGFPERWYAVGGPDIYHDSFTLSIFTAEPVFPALHVQAVALCGDRLVGFHQTNFLS